MYAYAYAVGRRGGVRVSVSYAVAQSVCVRVLRIDRVHIPQLSPRLGPTILLPNFQVGKELKDITDKRHFFLDSHRKISKTQNFFVQKF